jgi:hypothetical protein
MLFNLGGSASGAAPELLELMRDQTQAISVRRSAVWALGKMVDAPHVAGSLADLVRDRATGDTLREIALDGLAIRKEHDPLVRTATVEMLLSDPRPSGDILNAAFIAWERAATRAVARGEPLPDLAALIVDGSPRVQSEAIRLAGAFGPRAKGGVLQALDYAAAHGGIPQNRQNARQVAESWRAELQKAIGH